MSSVSLSKKAYTFGMLLGQGTFAEVYRATDEDGNCFAIKRLRQSLGDFVDEVVKVVSKEYHIMKKLGRHSSLLEVFDFYPDPQRHICIVLELASGGSAKTRLERTWGAADSEAIHTFAPDDLARVTIEVLAGLRHIHGAGVVHRDIKPENILFGEDDIAKVADFGSAALLDEISERVGGTTALTPGYTAPEINAMEDPTDKCDIWSLGVTLLEMGTGIKLNPKRNRAALKAIDIAYRGGAGWNVAEFMAGAPEPHRGKWAALGDGLQGLLCKCLEVDPEKRPTADELLKEPFLVEAGQRLEQARRGREKSKAAELRAENQALKKEVARLEEENAALKGGDTALLEESGRLEDPSPSPGSQLPAARPPVRALEHGACTICFSGFL